MSVLRKFLAIALVCAIAVWLATGCVNNNEDDKPPNGGGTQVPTPEPGATPPEGNNDMASIEMARLMGYGINLGNTMESCNQSGRIPNRDPSIYETMWGNPVTTQEMITGMRNSGFKTLRIPVAWTNAMDWENDDFTINEAYLDRVEEIMNYALNEDMYVIVNAHWDHGWWSMFGHPEQERRDFALEMFKAMWAQIADRYKDYDHRLIFEPSNEEWGDRFNDETPYSPSGGVLTRNECYELLTELSQVFVDLVRATGGNNPDRFLLMKGYNTDVKMTLSDRFVMPKDPANRLMLSVHYYTPWGYCGDTSGIGTWGRKTEVEEMNTLLGSLTKFTDQGYGVVLGEWGVLDNDGEDRLTFFTNFLNNCDLYGFAPILWDTGYTPRWGRLFDRNDTLTIVAPELLELFQTRSAARETKTVEQVIAAARDSMDAIRAKAADREETVLSADEAKAWIMFNSGSWDMEYSVGDRYQPEQIAKGIEPTDPEITGEGTYTVALDFTGTSQGYANGIAFSAIGIMNGEILFPGYHIVIRELLINGEEATLEGIPFTTNDNPVTTRLNLYNEWVSKVPPEARIFEGNIDDASPRILANYTSTRITSISITFDYIAP
ncbi:MAG: glycoside hydrolase family 5 protein [Oscillospiraceae bacterium]|nr:glycoside hydrolase family 5 protein [Oscillospiraceae bacterium]